MKKTILGIFALFLPLALAAAPGKKIYHKGWIDFNKNGVKDVYGSRTSLELPGRQQQLLERLVATGKPVIVVLVNGQPLTINWANKKSIGEVEFNFPFKRG